jgi:acyl-CoA thioester hydrolase
VTEFVAHVPMRWTDQDPYRHLNHARAVTLLEEARIALFFDRAGADGLATFATGLLVVGLDVAYKRQVAHRAAPLEVAMTVDEVRAASFRIAYELRDAGTAAITAHTRMATFDLQAQRPRRLTPDEREWLERWT